MKKILFFGFIIIIMPLLFVINPVQSQNANNNYSKANEMLISGKYDEAVMFYNMALKQNPEFIESYMGLGLAYKAQGDYIDAYKATSKFISLRPNNYQAYYNLGLILENLNRPYSAIIAYEKFLKGVPGADRFSDVKQRISLLKKALKN